MGPGVLSSPISKTILPEESNSNSEILPPAIYLGRSRMAAGPGLCLLSMETPNQHNLLALLDRLVNLNSPVLPPCSEPDSKISHGLPASDRRCIEQILKDWITQDDFFGGQFVHDSRVAAVNRSKKPFGF